MKASGRSVRLALAIAALAVGVLGCSQAPGAPTTVTATPPPATAAPPATVVPTDVAVPSPAPTDAVPQLEATWEADAELPDGGVALDMAMINDQPRFVPGSLTVPAGTLVVYLRNVPYLRVTHMFSLGPDTATALASSPEVAAGDAGVLTIADLPAGTYRFWCRLHGHHLAGMVGTLTVTP